MTELQNKSNQQEESIDLKAIFLKYSHYWYYFIISILFCLFVAFLYCRYSKPIYSVSSTLLIRDDNNSQLGAENLLEGLEIFSGRTNLKNEIALLNSYTITKQVVEDLGFVGIKGDSNGDDNVDILDIMYLIDIILNDYVPTVEIIWSMDMNYSENLNILDVTKLVHFILFH